jgi:hypothetical protein
MTSYSKSRKSGTAPARERGSPPAMSSRFRAFMDHPAGPKTIHFWAPAMKWGLVVAGLADLGRPAEKISLGQTICTQITTHSYLIGSPCSTYSHWYHMGTIFNTDHPDKLQFDDGESLCRRYRSIPANASYQVYCSSLIVLINIDTNERITIPRP